MKLLHTRLIYGYYCGELEQIFIENNHEPIIDLNTFYKVQEMKNKSIFFDDNQESVSMNM